MIKILIGALRDQGSTGVHLRVSPGNQRAAAFYRHIGFAELSAAAHSYLFGMELRGAMDLNPETRGLRGGDTYA